ncbi:MAG: hypothetical protein EPN39_11770 [Chitinophagaceae bacterium]|nr:MAG: hypothetical protein EPN39_11770 [Chitinophagaceae bacterium]
MSTLQSQKEHFKSWFDRTIKEQSEIRQELIGQSITEIFYTQRVEGWDITIKDETVIHIPLGYLTFVTSNRNIYEINTSYQSFCGGLFGIMLRKKETKETYNPSIFPLINQMVLDNKWSNISKLKINQIEWNWTEPTYKASHQILTKREALKYLFEDCFLPENLTFQFDNEKKIYFFVLEPDEEIIDKQTYKLLSCGEELMIFLDETKLRIWNINTIGFQIQVD